MKIGLLSDTHGWIHPRIFDFFECCNEIWHAGDIGNIETADKLNSFRPLKAVYGNIDDAKVRQVYGKYLRFTADELNVFITHIGGRPGRYEREISEELSKNPPDLFICGHSHIALIKYNNKYNFLHINPGAAGYIGFHKMMTAIRFSITGKKIHDLELIELGERGKSFRLPEFNS
jgi:putative phosphoesterase